MYSEQRTSKVKRSLLTAVMIVCLIAVIGGTYARYTSSSSGTASVDVAKWAVKINSADITSGDTFTITFTEVDNDDIVDGKIAPSGELYADFVIDPTGSEVSIDYSFTLGSINATSGSVPSGLAVERVCTVSGDTETNLVESSGVYSGTISLVDQDTALTNSEAVTVRVYIAWVNNESNNAADTTVGIAAPTLNMTVTGTAKQHFS